MTFQAELEKLDQLARVASMDTAQLKRQLQSRVNDVTALLARHTVQARPDAQETPCRQDRAWSPSARAASAATSSVRSVVLTRLCGPQLANDEKPSEKIKGKE